MAFLSNFVVFNISKSVQSHSIAVVAIVVPLYTTENDLAGVKKSILFRVWWVYVDLRKRNHAKRI